MDEEKLKELVVELVGKGSRRGVYAWDLPSRLGEPLERVERAIEALVGERRLRWVVKQHPNFLLLDETSSGDDVENQQLALGG